MEGHGDGAVLALHVLAAGAAQHHGGVSAPVEQHHDLLFAFEPFFDLGRQLPHPRLGRMTLRWALGAVGERFEVEAVDDRTRQIQALTGRGTVPAGGGGPCFCSACRVHPATNSTAVARISPSA